MIIALIIAAWIGFIPIYLFIIYMHEKAFFSYDFFVEGFFGMTVFIVVTAIALTLMSYVLFGFLITGKLGLIDKKRKDKNFFYRIMTYLFFMMSAAMHLYIFSLS